MNETTVEIENKSSNEKSEADGGKPTLRRRRRGSGVIESGARLYRAAAGGDEGASSPSNGEFTCLPLSIGPRS